MTTDANTEKRWMTVYDVAEVLDVSDWTVRRMIERDELPGVIKIGKKPLVKIDRTTFTRWLNRQAQETT